jgi:hypothetical protein
MKLYASLFGVCLFLCLALNSAPAFADDVDPKMAAQLAQIKTKCEQAQAANKREDERLEAAKSATNLPPQKRQEVEQEIQQLKSVIAKTDSILSQPLPSTRAEQESYLREASGAIAAARVQESVVARDLGINPTSRMDAVLSKLAPAEGPNWDGRGGSNAFVSHGNGTNFFGVAGQLPPSAIPSARNYAAYTPTTVEEATNRSNFDHGMGGGIMLEGVAEGLDPVSSVDYDSGVNALMLNGNLIYFVKIPPWSLATMCREIGEDRNALLGVSETGTDGLVFGDKPEIYKGSDLAYELMLADKFLGDLIFARPNGWTKGYKFPGTPPVEGKFKSAMLVRFAFGKFQFAQSEGQFSVVSSSFEVRMLPVSKAPSPTGQMLPDYNAMDKDWTPPDAFTANARMLTTNIDYFRHEVVIANVFADGETAAVLRWLKQSGRDLNALADSIDTADTE